jgi:exonuclease SbcC
LAQNDFAAFLKASDDERAELLQTLTGTSQFTDLSIRAYQRMRDEKILLEQLNNQLDMQAPMPADQRAECEAQAHSKAVAVKAIAIDKTAFEDQLRWHQRLASLTEAVTVAKHAQDAAQLDKQNAQPRKTELVKIDQVQEARPLRHALQRLQAEIKAQRTQAQQASGALDAAAATAFSRTHALSAAQVLSTSAEADRIKAQPQLDQAKALDVQINTLQAPMDAALKETQQAQTALDDSQAQLSAKQAQLQQAGTKHAQSAEWLAQHPELQTLAEGWQRFEILFAQAGSDLASQTKASSQAALLKEKTERLSRQLISAKNAFEDAKHQHETANDSLQASNQALALLQAPQLFERRQELNQQREKILSAVTLWQKIKTQKENLNQLKQQSQSQLTSISTTETELYSAQALAPLLARDCALLEQSLQMAQLAASLSAEGLRQQLQTGLACPVCGGLEHPFAQHQPYQDAVLTALKKNVLDKRHQSQTLANRLGVLLGMLNSAQTQLEQISAAVLVADQNLTQLQTQWIDPALYFELALVAENEVQVCLDLAFSVAAADLEKLAAEEINFQKARLAKEDFQVAKDQSQLALQSQKELLDTLVQEEKNNQEALLIVAQQLADLSSKINAALAQITSGFTDSLWQRSWHQDAVTFVENCKNNALSWNREQKNAADFLSHIQFLGNALESLALAFEKNKQLLAERSNQHLSQELVMQSIREKRKALLDGKSTYEHESELNRAVTAARAAQTELQALHQQAHSEHTRSAEVARQTAAQVISCAAQLSEAQAKFDAWLEAFQSVSDALEVGTDLLLKRLQRWLDLTPAWVASERLQLQELDSQLASAEAVLAQQSLNLTRHQTQYLTADDALAVAEKLSQLETTLQTVNDALTALRINLAEDDKRLSASADLRQKIQLQSTRTDLWARLGELIGSADGKKFRNFAQQMTLDILLGYANIQLQSLSKRYRLQRIKNSLGLLVVDQDMGDEVRSVHSLSGGESFLLSLALALGLASLSSHQVRVESLFIDEGFGSLDADALLLAMEALDKLQAQGRKVGVISHVQEMTERIGTRVQVQRMAGGTSKVVVS